MESIDETIATKMDGGRRNHRAGGTTTATAFAPMMYTSVAAGDVHDDGGDGEGGIAAPLLDPSPSSPLLPSTFLSIPRPSDLLLLDDDDEYGTSSSPQSTASIVRRNFRIMSTLFAINHGCSVSVLGLANARLGEAGVWSSGTLYATYTLSALFGTSLVVERLGCRNGLVLGMCMNAAYVASFFVASSIFFVVASSSSSSSSSSLDDENDGGGSGGGAGGASWPRYVVAISGAAVGGVGSSILWVSQGAYFATSSRLYASATIGTTTGDGRRRRRRLRGGGGGGGGSGGGGATYATPASEDATSMFGATFAFVFLLFEVMLRSLSTFLIRTAGLSWGVVFGLYVLLSILPACCMMVVADPERLMFLLDRKLDDRPRRTEEEEDEGGAGDDDEGEDECRDYKDDDDDDDDGGEDAADDDRRPRPPLGATAALDLLRKNPMTKYMIPICVLFGMSTSFASSVLNGEVIQRVLKDPDSTYVGLYTAVTSLVAAAASLLFGTLTSSRRRGGRLRCGKDAVLSIGAASYLVISLLFLFLLNWDRSTLLLIYTLLGVGRATYEGTLRAIFADYFPNDKVGAFGNIILFTGSASTIGYVLSVTGALECDAASRYCLEYSDGSIHNVLVMECVIIITALIAVPSFWRAAWMFRIDRRTA